MLAFGHSGSTIGWPPHCLPVWRWGRPGPRPPKSPAVESKKPPVGGLGQEALAFLAFFFLDFLLFFSALGVALVLAGVALAGAAAGATAGAAGAAGAACWAQFSPGKVNKMALAKVKRGFFIVGSQG